jgi:alpha-glucosidase
VYSVTFRGKPVIENSALGLELGENPPLGAKVTITVAEADSGVDEYALSNTKVSYVHDTYTRMRVHVAEANQEGSGRNMTMEARAPTIAAWRALPRHIA